ncbi:TIGR03032 family protein [Paenibacillus sp. HWE-109]|uniref:TIGR03032 family protein n=1 Tax=Paenibacillus sp. HWE-109 TaxID=1306526 RepID=UPI001EDFAD04|nr:TIGR03032 family protein [Paenibacillus sp. HWE-109]UKS24974.1 TIGR03032 family protein [Paenibacillus sp. HWE-109]
MKYVLVTTTCYLLLVNLEDGQVIPLEGNRQEYYGISWFKGDDRLVLSHSGIQNSKLKDLATYAVSERGWISAGEEKSPFFLSAPHQILCTSDDKIVCTNTGRNVITTIELSKPGYYHECGLSSERWDRLSPDVFSGDHLNSVFIKDDKLYVIAHRFKKGSWLGVFSYPEMQLLNIENLGPRSGLHNIWITDQGQRISCDSERGSLIDLDESTPVWISGSPIYTRGLAAHGNYVVVGESQQTGRDLRHSSISGLWIIDRSTWKAIDHISLGPYGVVHEVRLLDVPDMAHHNIPFAGLGKLLERESMLKDFSRKSLDVSKMIYENRSIWMNYEMIFGSPLFREDRFLHADLGQLSLIMKLHEDDHISFDFSFLELEDLNVRHISAVLDYKGEGDDRQMSLFLIQPCSESESVLSIWKNEGDSWERLSQFEYTGLPISGNMKVEENNDEMTIYINGIKLASINYADISEHQRTGAFGVRWTGAAIKFAN